jgi:vacuolar-type H+-ATPase subunit H
MKQSAYYLPEVNMASDSIKRISETEEHALQIEHEADSAAAALLADAESAARRKAANMDAETDEEVRRILAEAEEARLTKESDALQLAVLESAALRTDISPRIPAAIAAVRDLIIGKV